MAITFSISQLLSADPLMGNQMELDAIAAVVIGGATLYGGRGSMLGTLIGVFTMVMIRSGLNLMGVRWLWRAADSKGEVLDLLVQSRRDKKAAQRLMRKLLKKQGFEPTV